MRRRLLVYWLWALVTPAVIGAYAFSGARLAWTASARPQAPAQPWAFALAGPTPAGISSAVALVSYAVAHDHAASAREAIADGNRLLAGTPTGYRLAGRLGPHLIAVRAHDGAFFVCARADPLEGLARSRSTLVECAAGPLPLRFADIAWTSGRSLAAASDPVRYRRAHELDVAPTEPSTGTIAGLAIDWLSRLGHGRSGGGFALLLAASLLGIVALALRSPRRPAGGAAWGRAVAWAGALVAVDAGARLLCGPASPRLDLGGGIVNVSLGGAELHRHLSVWGDEGPVVALCTLLAAACAVLVARRRSSGLLLFAAAVTLLGTLTNLAEVGLRAYDTDYLWFGTALRTTPFNLGDVYEFGGGVVIAYCCLRAIGDPRAPRAVSPRHATGPRAGDRATHAARPAPADPG